MPRSTDMAVLALICSVDLEAAPLRERMRGTRSLVVGRRPATAGALGDTPVVLLAGGMGKTNAAQAATALLETTAVAGVVSFGVGGAFVGSGLQPGDVALATGEIYGDEGVDTPGGWISTESIGIPLVEHAGGRRCFNEFTLAAGLVEGAARALADQQIVVRTGPFVTVSCCSGTLARGAELERRFGALCETMEGAAVAHVCTLYEVPFLELRGISNLVTDRDLSSWRLREAADAAARAAAVVAGAWPSLNSNRIDTACG
jgi:futalosine hydrolase